eukprot:scaffold25770_cov147-Cylindrotheca_fusiformis.AAC.2
MPLVSLHRGAKKQTSGGNFGSFTLFLLLLAYVPNVMTTLFSGCNCRTIPTDSVLYAPHCACDISPSLPQSIVYLANVNDV